MFHKSKLVMIYFLVTAFFSYPAFDAFAGFSKELFNVQKQLKYLGYNPGPIDGIWGQKTQIALKHFQRDNNLSVNGKINENTRSLLNLLSKKNTKTDEKTFQFKIVDKDNETIIEGRFKGFDSNGDGWIDNTELISFSEKVYQTCLSGKIKRKGWKEFVEEKEYPKIFHTLQDVKQFRFGVRKWNRGKGVTILEFKTDTNKLENFAVRGYLFWRKTELKENGRQADFFNGVSDGKEGLVLCMSEAENLRILIK